MMVDQFIQTFIKFFFLLTPFFLLSTFLAMTRDMDLTSRKQLAVKVTFAVIVISLVLFSIGNYIFALFGITLNAFRIGTGILLFFSALSLVQGEGRVQTRDPLEDISVVPLAIPVTVGPATTGTLLVMGGELHHIWEKFIGVIALCAAIIAVGALLYVSGAIERVVKKQGITILSKVTGLVLAALAAQMVMTGIIGFFAGV